MQLECKIDELRIFKQSHHLGILVAKSMLFDYFYSDFEKGL